MARTDVAAAANARVTRIVEYGVDPRGAGLFASLTGAASGVLAGALRVVDPQRRFNGIAANPQKFVGLAPLGLARPVVKANAVLSDERASALIDDPSLRIFAERLGRGR